MPIGSPNLNFKVGDRVEFSPNGIRSCYSGLYAEGEPKHIVAIFEIQDLSRLFAVEGETSGNVHPVYPERLKHWR